MKKNAKRALIIVAVVALGFVVVIGALVYSLMPGLTMVRGQ
jgi:hypothetical protein